MKRHSPLRRVRSLSALPFVAGLAALVAPAAAQEVGLPGTSSVEDAQQEMIRLFHEVERTLGEIDVELYDAGAGRIPAPEGRESGMERLLQSSGAKSDQAVTGIERILEIAQQLSSKSGGT